MKIKCKKCKLNKDFRFFYKHKSNKNGFFSRCKKCEVKIHREYFLKNREKLESYNKQYLRNLRSKIISNYGNKCNCCGIKTKEFLSIDHVNGGGRKHLRKLGGGSSLILFIIRNNYPKDFQILCYNCNFAKREKSKCPHQHE